MAYSKAPATCEILLGTEMIDSGLPSAFGRSILVDATNRSSAKLVQRLLAAYDPEAEELKDPLSIAFTPFGTQGVDHEIFDAVLSSICHLCERRPDMRENYAEFAMSCTANRIKEHTAMELVLDTGLFDVNRLFDGMMLLHRAVDLQVLAAVTILLRRPGLDANIEMRSPPLTALKMALRIATPLSWRDFSLRAEWWPSYPKESGYTIVEALVAHKGISVDEDDVRRIKLMHKNVYNSKA